MGIWRQEENYNRWELTCYLRHENALGWEKFLAGHTTIDHLGRRQLRKLEIWLEQVSVGAGLGWRERRRLQCYLSTLFWATQSEVVCSSTQAWIARREFHKPQSELIHASRGPRSVVASLLL
ncbi:hypothetical protein HYFRA_00009656 [Hymenoscyphus fraxineus]|uniref:Uncharacterized protein n=1 Tax=Hymenoscyphus fraxineus TaxID=746836 RepID=A0A9N9PMN6_9HELO|nr:hypothetical protein HYFRA_00009656 [Hymenoscyphus fraxineus]